jgi:hypothetical protein
LDTNFQEHYASVSDDELLHIAGARRDLRKEAVLALDGEMARRGLTHEQARAKKRDEFRLDVQEARAHQRKKSRYFVNRISLGALLIVFGGELVLMLLITPREPLYAWLGPVLVVYFGTSIACLAVQPWVRRTVSFWASLVISCLPQVVVSHWLTVHHPAHSRGDSKGSWFLSILSGYVVGGAVFLLLQKLRPAQGRKATD